MGVAGKLYAKANIVNLAIWALWWPAMVWTAVLFGRVWCAVCPIELVANCSERIGRRLGVTQRVPPGWLRAGTLIVVFYALLLMLVPAIELHRTPAYTSVFLFAMLATAAVIGFFFKHRTFCWGFCPVGLLLGTYGRGGMVAVRPKTNGEGPDARSCPSLLNPSTLDTNRDCLVCCHCVKASQAEDVQLLVRRPFHAADRRDRMASWPVTLFVMVVSGFVVAELFSEWKTAQAVFLRPPTGLATFLGQPALAGWFKGIWIVFVFPLALWLVLGAMYMMLRGANSMAVAWRRLAVPLVAVFAAGHMAKGLAKFVSWAGYVPHVLNEPMGVNTSRAMQAGTVAPPPHLLPLSVVSVLGTVLVAAGLYFALREARLTHPDTHLRHLLPTIALAGFFLFLVFGWGFLQ